MWPLRFFTTRFFNSRFWAKFGAEPDVGQRLLGDISTFPVFSATPQTYASLQGDVEII